LSNRRILDRDHRLCGKVLQQRDLLFGERPHLLTIDNEYAQNRVVFAERYCELRAGTARVHEAPACLVALPGAFVLDKIRDVDKSFTADYSQRRGPRFRNDGLFEESRQLGRHAPGRYGPNPFAVIHVKRAAGGLAQAHRLVEHRVEHRREVAGRGIDDPQHLGGRGLLLQGLARLGQQPCILHRDHRLRCKVLQQRDLLV
jgi:hypothetical protein